MSGTPKKLVWLITGTSSGFGQKLALAALQRGDNVIACARGRSVSKLAPLEKAGASALELDVTTPLDELERAAKKAVDIHGRVDVVVNNAGYIEFGSLEESTPERTFDQFNTNVFGALNVTRAFLPYLRKQKSGTVVFMGSLGGWRAVPFASLYAGTKQVLRGISESLHEEISPFGLRSICFDPGYFRTEFLASDNRGAFVNTIADYKEGSEKMNQGLINYNGKQPGDPEKGASIMVDVIRGEGAAQGKPFPKFLALGSDCYQVVKSFCESKLKEIEEWKDVTLSTDFPKGS